ncbi:hypothetical protein X777_01551 [Ooceraea biroi]|uniref:Uncharacterized protein n=1 Tax=Ooceraea biroi TaxID=2015173 RepID=A0A026WQ70_OOCBI|nr:hypothetical protein X777_01551 [Ooceraea biroi]
MKYNLAFNADSSIKTMMGNVLTALVSTIMLIIGDIYGIPYLYLPWLISTIEGMILHETPTLYALASTELLNTSVPKGFFIFLTLIVYVEELCICKDVWVNFKHCWTNYNKNKLDVKSEGTSKESCDETKTALDISSEKLEDQQEIMAYSDKSNNNDVIKPAMNLIKSSLSFQNLRKHMSFTEVSG